MPKPKCVRQAILGLASLVIFSGNALSAPIHDPLLDQMEVWAPYQNFGNPRIVRQQLSLLAPPNVPTHDLLSDGTIWALSFVNLNYVLSTNTFNAALTWTGGSVARTITNPGSPGIGFGMELPISGFASGMSTLVTLDLNILSQGTSVVDSTRGSFYLVTPVPEPSNFLLMILLTMFCAVNRISRVKRLQS